MGEKNPNDSSFKEFVLDQLDGLSVITSQPLFGGFGLYLDGEFFAVIYDGRVYFKTDLRTRQLYIEQGMRAFRPNEKQTLKNYYEVPGHILEDSEEFLRWALVAVQVPS